MGYIEGEMAFEGFEIMEGGKKVKIKVYVGTETYIDSRCPTEKTTSPIYDEFTLSYRQVIDIMAALEEAKERGS